MPLNLVVDNDTLKSTVAPLPRLRDRDPNPSTSNRFPSTVRRRSALRGPRGSRRGAVPHLPRPGRATVGELGLRAAARRQVWPTRAGTLGEVVHRDPTRNANAQWGCQQPRTARQPAVADGGVRPVRRGTSSATCRGSARSTTPRSAPTAKPTASAATTTRPPNWRRAKPRSGSAPTTAGASAATAASDVQSLRPRALTLTLFARVCLGDFFIHGIGGGKYDEVTDAIIRDYFGIEPARVPGALRDAAPAAARRSPRPRRPEAGRTPRPRPALEPADVSHFW